MTEVCRYDRPYSHPFGCQSSRPGFSTVFAIQSSLTGTDEAIAFRVREPSARVRVQRWAPLS